jgi:hypothetical protein
MGSFKHPYAFDPLDLEIIDRVYEAAWLKLKPAIPAVTGKRTANGRKP